MFLKWIKALKDVILPEYCAVCDSPLSGDEKFICFSCYEKLPFTYDEENPKNNPVYNRFAPLYNVHFAGSLLFYQKKGATQKILQNLKYRNDKYLGIFLGTLLAKRFSKHLENLTAYKLVPVPLHAKKLYKRGYNQAEQIALGISKELQIPVSSDVIRSINTKTQTKKIADERQQLIHKDTFKVKTPIPKAIVVDDVITTGSTLDALLRSLKNGGTTDFVVLSVARALK